MLETVFAEKLGTRGVRWMDGWIDEKFRCCMGGNFSKVTVMAVTVWLASKLEGCTRWQWGTIPLLRRFEDIESITVNARVYSN